MSTLFGVAIGLAVFLVGLRVMGRSLVAAAGGRLRRTVHRLTSNRYTAFAVGVGVTAVVQSSSAVNVISVGLVGGGLLDLERAFAIMLGANVGTTVTAQIIALPVADQGLGLVGAGLVGWFLSHRNPTRQTWFAALIGLGGLFFGLQIMKGALAPLGHAAMGYVPLLVDHGRPVWILSGLVVTAVIQSSSAVTGMVIALVHSGVISSMAGICIALGSNIGTVTTTLLASLGLSREAKMTALADLVFNVIGVLMIYPFLTAFQNFISDVSHNVGGEIANAHTFFNVVTAAALLPFLPWLTRLFGGGRK